MRDMDLITDNEVLELEMEVETREYPVIPNPEGEPTEDITKMEIDDVIYGVKDAGVHDWARAEEKPSYTKAEVGLGNVDNTSDLNKPVSTATQAALDLKADSSSVYTKTESDNLLNGKVDKDGDKVLSDNNYSDEDKEIVDGVTSALDGKVDKVEGYGLSKNDYTDEEKAKVGEIDNKLDKTETAVNSNGLVIATPVTDTAPYIYRQTPVKESFKALMKKIVGASVVWNQLRNSDNITSTSNGITTVRTGNNIKITGQAEEDVSSKYLSYDKVYLSENHIVLILMNKDYSSLNAFFQFGGSAVSSFRKSTIRKITVASDNRLLQFRYFMDEEYDIDTYINVIDLTAMFGTTIADYVYTLETSQSGSGIAWLQSYGFFTEDYYAYKQNKLESGCVSAHKTYDGETLLTNTELSPITLRGLFKLSTDKLTVDGDEYNADGSHKIFVVDKTVNENSTRKSTTVLTNVTRYAYEIPKTVVRSKAMRCVPEIPYLESYSSDTVHFYCDNSGSGGAGRFYLFLPNDVTTFEYTVLYNTDNPTTEQTTPFTETEIVGSTEEFIDYEVAQGNRDVAIPVGTETDYYQEMKLPSLPTTSGNHNLIYNVATGFGWS